MLPLEPGAIAAVLLVYFLAGTVKGVLGFGLPIITMASLPFLVDVQSAIVLSAVVQPATNIFQLISSGGVARAFKVSWPVLLTLIPGISLGAWYLTALDANTLLFLVGLTIVVFSVLELSGFRFSIQPKRRFAAGLGFGALAGVFGALTSLNGWTFIMYLMGIGLDRKDFRSAIGLLFLVSGFFISTSFWVVGILDMQLLLLGAVVLVPAFLGMWAGDLLGKKIPADLFRRLVLLALVLIGSAIALRGIF